MTSSATNKYNEFIEGYIRQLERRIERNNRILKNHEDHAGDVPVYQFYNYFGGYSAGYRSGVIATMDDTIGMMEALKKLIEDESV